MVDRYFKQVIRMAIEMAKEDPFVAKAALERLIASGEVDARDVAYLVKMCDEAIQRTAGEPSDR